jgi:hypothetical protein
MIAATGLAIIFVPMFFKLVTRSAEGKAADETHVADERVKE